MNGTAGNDSLIGTAGNDTIIGAGGNDTLIGGAGDDLIYGDAQSESPASGAVTNGTFSAGLAGWITTNPTAGNVYAVTDRVTALGFNGGEGAAGGTAEQTVTTTPGTSYTLGYVIGETAAGSASHTFRIDILDANGTVIATRTDTVADETASNLTLTYTATTGATTIRITNTATSNTVNSDGYVDNIVNAPVAQVTARMADNLSGGIGNDTIFGGAGADTITGDAGNDSLVGGGGSDSLIGGGGDDRFVFASIDNNAGPNTAATYSPAAVSPVGVNTATTGNQSPPKMVVLNDGRVMYVWTDAAEADNSASMVLQVRIFNANGTPATSQISLSSWQPIDGSDLYDWDNLDVDLLPNGNVVIGYVRSTTVNGASDEPLFGILHPTATGVTTILSPVAIQSSDTTTNESPPITTVMSNGNILFTWSKNATSDDVNSMWVMGRVYDTANQTWLAGEFRVGNVAVDGTAGTVPQLTVTQLAGGNVVVGWARSNIETGYKEPVYSVIDATGATVFSTAEIEGTDNETQGTVWESPPIIRALPDGRWIAAWVNDGYSDNSNNMTLEVRVFNADGTPASGDIRIGTTAVDGSAFKSPNVTMITLPNGRVVVGYAETYATNADTKPFLSVFDPTTGQVIASDVNIAVTLSHAWSGPPQLVALGDSGYFVAAYIDGNGNTGTTTGLKYRVFDQNGTAVTGEYTITATTGNASLSGLTSFDWASFSAVYNPANMTLTVGWAGNSDGAGTGVYTSGPIDMGFFVNPPVLIRDEIVVGGETDETVGDTLDLATMTADVSVVFTGAEAGTVTSVANAQRISFSQIELVALGSGNDSVIGSAAAEHVTAGAGNDSVAGGGGNDTLIGEAGNDTLDGASGHDMLYGGAGDDRIFGGTENDTLDGGNGADSLDGGDGSDSLAGGAGADTLIGGAGNDSIAGGTDHDVLSGGAGDDAFALDAGFGNDTITGGETGETLGDTLDAGALAENVTLVFSGPEAGTLSGASGSTGFTEIENVRLGSGNDTVSGGAGNDHVDAGDGNDLLSGAAGNDRLLGGTGNDTIAGGSGNDTLTGGAGADVFTLQNADGADTITDFQITRVNGRSIDRLDVSDMTNATGGPLYWRDVTVTDTNGDGTGDAVLVFPNGQSVVLQGVTPASVTGRGNMEAIGIPCFAKGTRVMTPAGWRKVEEIRIGDPVMTRDGTAETVLWVGSRALGQPDLVAQAALLPVTIKAGALGNKSAVRLSQQHAVLMRLEGREVLVRAVHLARNGYRGVRIARGTRRIVYHHLLLPHHAVLNVEGMPAESLYPGRHALTPMTRIAQAEIASTVLMLRGAAADGVLALGGIAALYGPKVWPVLTGAEVAGAIGRGALQPVARIRVVATGSAGTAKTRPKLRLVQAA